MKDRKAFTLVELLLVIAIIAILVGILMPTMVKVKEVARRMTCATNLHNISTGTYAYMADSKNRMMPFGCQKPEDDPWAGNMLRDIIWGETYGGPEQHKPVNLGALMASKYIGGTWDNDSSVRCPTEEAARHSTPQRAQCQDHKGVVADSNPVNNNPSGSHNPCTVYGPWHNWISAYIRQVDWNAGPRGATASTTSVGELLTSMDTSKAMFADSFNAGWQVSQRHRDGVNTLFVNGSVRYIRDSGTPYLAEYDAATKYRDTWETGCTVEEVWDWLESH